MDTPKIQTTEIPGVLVYQRSTFEDDRGFFREPLEKRDLEKFINKEIDVTQWNHSRSVPGVIRGFHAEPWDKIIYAVRGEAMAALVDLRTDSSTFGKAIKITLGENERKTLFVPQGVGNSVCNIGTTDLDYMYLITGYFEGKPTPAINYNDPVLTKQFGGWAVENPIVSEKDKNYPTLKEKFGSELDFSKFPWLNL